MRPRCVMLVLEEGKPGPRFKRRIHWGEEEEDDDGESTKRFPETIVTPYVTTSTRMTIANLISKCTNACSTDEIAFTPSVKMSALPRAEVFLKA